MADYRIYLLDGTGHIASGTDAICADDQEARVLAERMLNGGGQAEVWAGTRCVGQVSAEPAEMEP